MTPEAIKDVVIRAISRIAPEATPASIQPTASLREQLDLDSVDFLNLMVALHEQLGVDIPEADYPKLSTLDGAVAYLAAQGAAHR
jgi:acyl carrier protein